MTVFSDHSMESIQSLFDFCNHILEEDYSSQALLEMQDTMEVLQTQAGEYKKQLLDQELNSKSGISRDMAKLLGDQESQLEEMIRSAFPKAGDKKSESENQRDLNVGALYVEYLTERANQSLRDALIGAIQLKLLSEECQK